jgi:hypothetical protein
MNTHMNPSTRPIIAALEAAWKHAQAAMPAMQIPDVVIVLGSGTTGRQAVRGHFAAGRWAQGKTTAHHEVLVAGERLADGPEAVLSTLLHEAAHAGCHALGIEDTSRGGRYHNKRFQAAAESLGLTTDKHPTIGVITTGLADEARDAYLEVLADLAKAIDLYRHSETEVRALVTVGGSAGTVAPRNTRKSNNNGRSLACACATPRKIRVAVSTADLGPIVCGICGEVFA